MLVEHIINETYVNAVGNSDKAMAIKNQYKDQVWDVLQKSYASIGGIKGRGFESPEAMLDLPMWKMGVRNGVVKAVIMYKDSGGRKSVAVGTDRSPEGGWFINDAYAPEIERAYGEKSKAALGKLMKTVPWDVLKNFTTSPDRAAQMMPEDKVVSVKQLNQEDWPADAKITLDRYPQLLDYGYLRDIGGQMMFKVMFGTPGKTIR